MIKSCTFKLPSTWLSDCKIWSQKWNLCVFNTDTTTWSMYNRSKLEKVLNVVFLQQKKIHGLGIKLHNKTTLVLARYLQKRAGSRCFYFLCTKRTQWRKSLWSMQRLHCAQHVTWKAKLARIWVVSFFLSTFFFCEMTKSQSKKRRPALNRTDTKK